MRCDFNECPEVKQKVCDKFYYHEVPCYVPFIIKKVNHHVFCKKYIPVYQEVECNVCEMGCDKM